jgi:hypothetical protein
MAELKKNSMILKTLNKTCYNLTYWKAIKLSQKKRESGKCFLGDQNYSAEFLS